MTKLRIMSDLHLEFGPLDLEPLGEDVLVLAGDIGLDDIGAHWAARYGERHDIPIVMIAGNHEFYNHGERPPRTIDETLKHLRAVNKQYKNFYFLENTMIRPKPGPIFIGHTLWTDYKLKDDPESTMNAAWVSMNDHRLIYETENSRFTPHDALRRHLISRGFAAFESFARPDGPIVILTHHLPSARSIAGRYADSAYNAAYASNLDDLVERSGAALWVHGHTHISQDYCIGNTRVICNPRGYYGHEVNPAFDPNLIVEV